MVNAVAMPALDSAVPSRARWRNVLSPHVALLPSALLLGVLRVWSLALARWICSCSWSVTGPVVPVPAPVPSVVSSAIACPFHAALGVGPQPDTESVRRVGGPVGR
mgnify:CR=1 FL=1